MLTYLRLDGVDLHDHVEGAGARDVTRATGLVGLSAPRGESRARSEQHGSVNRARWLSSKVVTIEGECWGDTIDDAYEQYAEVEETFYGTLTDPAGKLLEWPRMDGIDDLQARVKLAGELMPPIEEGAALLRYQAQLEQMDPRAYSQTLQSIVGAELAEGGGGLMFPFIFPVDFTESAGGIASVVNDGRIETPPLIRIYGPATSPKYVLDSSDLLVKIIGEIGDGDYLEVDHADRTVRLNGTTLRMNLLDAVASRFFDVPEGEHELRVFASSFSAGARIEVDLRSAYGG